MTLYAIVRIGLHLKTNLSSCSTLLRHWFQWFRSILLYFSKCFAEHSILNLWLVSNNFCLLLFNLKGYVYHDKAYYNHTLISFLRQMWTTLRKNRQNFDHQLLSTGIFRWYIIRPIHWIWTYIICGVLTTMVLIIFWPTLCILCSTTSIVVGVLSIPVIPLLSLLAHLLGLLFWNAYTPGMLMCCSHIYFH